VDLAALDPNPVVQFARWHEEVLAAALREPATMALATAGTDGRPRVRHVLLKGFDDDGFVWFTSYRSRKGRHLAANPYASLTFPWFAIHRQVIVSGPVTELDAAASDEYFATRDRGSQLGAWASEQSEPIPDRTWLEARMAEFDARFAGGPVARPPHWGGYRLRPDEVEFWEGRRDRLHDRFLYERDGSAPNGWRITRLAP
jgi:pyridoxamine 5'-phosphate oxidase